MEVPTFHSMLNTTQSRRAGFLPVTHVESAPTHHQIRGRCDRAPGNRRAGLSGWIGCEEPMEKVKARRHEQKSNNLIDLEKALFLDSPRLPVLPVTKP
jgi:hypothetical protein